MQELSSVVIKRTIWRVIIIIALYPILLGGVANMQERYRLRWMQMRQEHREAIARDKPHHGLLAPLSR